MRNIAVTLTIVFILMLGGTFAEAKTKRVKTQPRKLSNYDEFYEMTRLIMLKDERRIYKNLQSIEDKKAFIKDFWKKRDQFPGTAINENKVEFYRRALFAERWYRERIGKGRGWDSDRGKMYLLLGEPDQKVNHTGYVGNGIGSSVKTLKESWYYDYYGLVLQFADVNGLGRYRISNWSPRVIGAVESAKFDIQHQGKPKQAFKFKAKYANGELRILIPSKTVSFDESDDIMEANFKITVYVYKDYKRVDDIVDTVSFIHRKEDMLKGEKIDLAIPVPTSEKGKYLFDIIVEDTMADSRYRDMLKMKI
ncbi:MAG: GWxTD domain-containing protein [bacterium]|nr:GWxTD domain-containing protein [bacterium]